MGNEVVYCSHCQTQLRGADFEKQGAFKIDGVAYCSKCLPEALKTLPKEKVKEVIRLLQSGASVQEPSAQPGTSRISMTSASEASAKPASTRIMSSSAHHRRGSTGMHRNAVWAVGAGAGLVVVVIVGFALSGRTTVPSVSQPSEPRPPAAAATQRLDPALESPKEASAGAKLLVQAREFARNNPADLVAQLDYYERAVRELDGQPERKDADREAQTLRARISDAIAAALSALEGTVKTAVSEERFKDALDLLEKAGARYPRREWAAASEGETRLIQQNAASRYAVLKEQAVEARRGGDDKAVKRILDRVKAWGLSELLVDLQKAVEEKIEVPAPPAAPLAAKTTEPAPKPEVPSKKEEPDKPAPAPRPDLPPLKIALTAPRGGVEVTTSATVVIVAEVKGDVEKVEFFEGANKLGEKAAPPYEWPWKAPKPGSYNLLAKVTGRNGESAACEPVAVLATLFSRKPQKPAGGHPKVDQRRVDEAIRKGIEYLRKSGTPGHGEWGDECVELVLLAMLHAGVPEQDPYVQKLLERMLNAPLCRTYNVSLQAVVLEKLDRVRFQKRIFHCAQFLVDNQLESGDWGYSKSTELGEPEKIIKLDTPSGKRPSDPEDGKRVRAKVVVKRNPAHIVSGHKDASNAQYAALGLRACYDAGVVLPRETIDRAIKNWRSRQLQADGGSAKAVATGDVSAIPAGWGYVEVGTPTNGAMTAGAVGALAIYGRMLDQHWRADKDIQEGLSWMSKNFTPATNPNRAVEWQYYWLYAVERVGMLLGIEAIGSHEWYPEGANHILDQQKPDGSWVTIPICQPVWNTCFAILFLKRGTRPLQDVASVDQRR